jgi:hypothetical protein
LKNFPLGLKFAKKSRYITGPTNLTEYSSTLTSK